MTKGRVDMATGSEKTRARPTWANYTAAVWCIVFGGLHLYWVLGGNVGLTDFSTPSAQAAALTRDPIYMAMAWGVVAACAIGIVVSLAPLYSWGKRIPRWILLPILFVASLLSLVRGFGNPIQTLLVIGNVVAFPPLLTAEATAWYRWLLLDSIVFSPSFILAGVAFTVTTWSVLRQK